MYKKNSDQLRIFILTESFYPPIIGGQQLFTSQLSKRLSAEGMQISVITRKVDPTSECFEEIDNVRVRRLSPTGVLKGKGFKALFPILITVLKVFFLLIKSINEYDILFVVSFKILSIPAVIAKSIFGKKCIVAVISPSELQEDILSDESLRKMRLNRKSAIVKFIKTIRNPIIRKTDLFVGLSSEIKQQYINMGILPEKIRIIPNGINIKKFSPVSNEIKIKLRKELGIPEDKIVFCYAGRIARTKGVMLLIEVWKQILNKHRNLYLLIVGSGKNSYDDCENELRKYINHNNLNENVCATGRVEEINVYLQSSDVFVFPSFYEGFGYSILEGLACGLPAVLTRVGAANEAVENCRDGVLVNPQNSEELYNAIEWMLDHKHLWESMGINARKSVEKYGIEAETDKYVEIFTEVLNNKN